MTSPLTQIDLALQQTYPCMQPMCGGHVRLVAAKEPILTLEGRAWAAIAGRNLDYAWMPHGAPLAMCENGHLDMAQGTNMASVRRAVEETRRLSAKSHLTGAQRTRLRRMQARTNRFYDSQRRDFKRQLDWWNRVAQCSPSFTTYNVEAPITARDLSQLVAEDEQQ